LFHGEKGPSELPLSKTVLASAVFLASDVALEKTSIRVKVDCHECRAHAALAAMYGTTMSTTPALAISVFERKVSKVLQSCI